MCRWRYCWSCWAGWPRVTFFLKNSLSACRPTLIAFLPQPALYTINNDVLSPLTFGAAFVLLLKFFDTEKPSALIAAAAGLCLAAAFLTKITNLPLLTVAGVFILWKTLLLARRGTLRAWLVPLLVLLLVAGVPMAGWMAWCKTTFGDLTGLGPKVTYLNWTRNPPSLWFDPSHFYHPRSVVFFEEEPVHVLAGRNALAWPAHDEARRSTLAYVILTFGALRSCSSRCCGGRRNSRSRNAPRFGWDSFASCRPLLFLQCCPLNTISRIVTIHPESFRFLFPAALCWGCWFRSLSCSPAVWIC